MGFIARLFIALLATLFAVMMFVSAPSSEHPLFVYAFGGFCFSFAVAYSTHGRVAQFFGSLIGLGFFAIGVAYFASELIDGNLISQRKSQPSILGSIFFMLFFGVPGALYVWYNRFGFGEKGLPMHYIITFTTSKFDVTKEDENPINPIYGQSLLIWLKNKVSDKAQLDEPDVEDWGWYTSINWNGNSYLLGASASKITSSDYEWVFQIDKHRTLLEEILGKNKMTKDDDCLLFFKSIFDSEPEFKNVIIE